MKTIITFAAALALSMATAGYAAADSQHGHGNGSPMNNENSPDRQADMMQDMMRMMMPMMTRMHGQMMGAGPGSGMAMMDDDMMRMMMGPDMMGRMVDAPEPGALRAALAGRLSEFDANGDGSLSLTEFEALHAAMIRETTVDRFQLLDADGDARITETEMGAPARRMEMRRGMPGAQGPMGGQMRSGN